MGALQKLRSGCLLAGCRWLDAFVTKPESSRALTEFLQSNVSLVIGAVLLLVTVGVRTVTKDRYLRQDLRSAFWLLAAFILLRVTAWVLGTRLTGTPEVALRLSWMVLFAFGVIRASVATGLWIFRFRSSTPTPKILRDTISFPLYLLAFLPILKATLQIDLAGLVATSAILSVVLGFALQDTLGNFFAGVSLQLERPFEVGDVVSVGSHLGTIAQIGWRATRIETFRGESITLPNNVVAKEAVTNYSRGGQPIGIDVYVNVGLSAPPNRVKDAVMDTLAEMEEVLTTPGAHCRTWGFRSTGIRYQVRFFVRRYEDSMPVMEQLYTRLWYRFERDGIELPLPQRVVHMRGEGHGAARATSDEALGLLSSVDLLALLKPEDLKRLATEVVHRRFGAGERVIAEGEEGHTFYVIAQGEVSVRAGPQESEITRLGRGQYFGEMSLLTGEPRAATVVALADTELFEIGRGTFASILSAHPGLATALADLLARRRTELKAAANANDLALEAAPEARRIFGRLKDLFGIADA